MSKSHGVHVESRGGFVRLESQEKGKGALLLHPTAVVPDDGGRCSRFLVYHERWKLKVTPTVAIILLYMLVSMSLTLLDKWLITGWGFNAPLALISLTYLTMHLVSLSIRARLRRRRQGEGVGVRVA
ncbi:unnamed protein product, partial [Pylaiella littoralis]